MSLSKLATITLVTLALLAGCNAFDASRLAPAQRAGTQETGPEQDDAPDAATADSLDSTEDTEVGPDGRQDDDDGPVLDMDDDDAGTGEPDTTEPCGACGCDVEVTDSDNDEVPDCADACPADPEKAKPGLCGCHHPDRDEGSVVSCSGLIEALAHRYRFDGDGTAVADVAGGADAALMSGMLDSDSVLELTGGATGPYVDLPNGTISALSNATFEVWVSWSGVSDWERIFDFGDSTAGTEDATDYGASYLFLSPRVNIEGVKTMRAAFTHDGDPALVIVDGDPLPTTGVHHVAVVVDDSNDQLRLYMNGVLQGSAVLTQSLSSIRDINNWIGRSQFTGDKALTGEIHEMRIYDRALSEGQIAVSVAAGADPEFLESKFR
jgi:hypothetical protein